MITTIIGQVEFVRGGVYAATVRPRRGYPWPELKPVAETLMGVRLLLRAVRVIKGGRYCGEWCLAMPVPWAFEIPWIASGDVRDVEPLGRGLLRSGDNWYGKSGEVR